MFKLQAVAKAYGHFRIESNASDASKKQAKTGDPDAVYILTVSSELKMARSVPWRALKPN